MIFDHQVLKSAKDLILRLRTEDESSKSLAAAMEEVNYNQLIKYNHNNKTIKDGGVASQQS